MGYGVIFGGGNICWPFLVERSGASGSVGFASAGRDAPKESRQIFHN